MTPTTVTERSVKVNGRPTHRTRSDLPRAARPRTLRQDGGMPAYWISNYRAVRDNEKMAAYAALAAPALIDAGGRFLARGLPEQVY